MTRDGTTQDGTTRDVEEVRTRSTDRPAVGVVASGENTDAVVRTVLRARERGHAVFVTYESSTEPESARLAEHLGAEVLPPSGESPSSDALQELLAATAQANSYPGLILQTDPSNRIDYSRSVSTVEDGRFCESAVAEGASTGDGSAHVLVAIPAYNEVGTIRDVVTDAAEHADQVLVVDDGSDDRTAQVAEESGADVVRHDQNRGYGAALNTAFEEAKERGADHLVVIDGDGQHDPDDIPALVGRQAEGEADIVIGSRFAEGSETEFPLYRRVGLFVVNRLTNLSMGIVRSSASIKDTQSGFRVYGASAIESLAEDPNIGDHMNASTNILYHANRRGYDVEEVGTTVDYDVDEASNHNPLSHGLLLVNNILRTVEQRRPVTVLGVPGFVAALVGLVFGFLTVSNFLRTGTFPMGLAIVSAFVALAGIFASFTAIILHSLNMHLKG